MPATTKDESAPMMGTPTKIRTRIPMAITQGRCLDMTGPS